MSTYQNLSRNVGEGMKSVFNTVGSILAAPLTLPGVRKVTKSAIKGGIFVSEKTQTYFRQVNDQWNELVSEAKTEMKKPVPKKSLSAKKDYETWNHEELYELAQELDIKGRSTMSKEELVKEINKIKKK